MKTAAAVNRASAKDKLPNGQPLPAQDATSIDVTYNNIIGTKNKIYMMYKDKDKNHPDVRAGLESLNLMMEFANAQ